MIGCMRGEIVFLIMGNVSGIRRNQSLIMLVIVRIFDVVYIYIYSGPGSG